MVHAILDQENNRIRLRTQWNEVELVKSIPGFRYLGVEKIETVPLTWASMVTLRGIFGPYFTYDEDLAGWTWRERLERIDDAMLLRDAIESPVDPDDPLSAKMFPFQRADVEFMHKARTGLLGNAAGTGKTISALSLLRRLGPDSLPGLVVAPNSVLWHWANRVETWCPFATAYVVEGDIGAKRKILKEAEKDPCALIIISYETARAFSRLAPYGSVRLNRCIECDPKYGDATLTATRCHIHPKELNKISFQAMVIDEAHKIGDPMSQQTRAIWAVAHQPTIEYRWAMTGTPDNIERLWSIMHTVAPDEYPTRSKWMDRYALQDYNYFGGSSVVGFRPDTREEAFRILDPHFRRMIKEVVLPQLPPKTREVRFCHLSPAMRKAYQGLHKKLHTRLPDGTMLIALDRLSARSRLMQFASANVEVSKPDEDDVRTWNVTMVDPSPKLDVLQEVLDELGRKPIVIACWHRDLVEMTEKRLTDRGLRVATIMGGGNSRDHAQLCEDLKAGRLDALVFTISAGGIGLDMSGVDTLIFLQRSWSIIEDIQTEERVLRIGSEIHQNIRVIDIVARDTVEEDQITTLHQKLDQLDEITRDRAQLARRLRTDVFSEWEYQELIDKMQDLTAQYLTVVAVDDLGDADA